MPDEGLKQRKDAYDGDGGLRGPKSAAGDAVAKNEAAKKRGFIKKYT